VKDVGRQIIVADDMNYVIIAMKALFETVFLLDTDVVTYVRDGQEVLDLARENLKRPREGDHRPITLMILDFNMPMLNGLEVIDLIKELYWSAGEKQPPFFMMHTSNQEKAFRDRCLSLGVGEFAEKPVKEEKLAQILLKGGFIKKYEPMRAIAAQNEGIQPI